MYTKDLRARKEKLESDISNYLVKVLETFKRDTTITVREVDIRLSLVDVSTLQSREELISNIRVKTDLAL